MERKNVNTDVGTGTNTEETIQRIAVSKQAQNALTAIVERINDGFSGGKVNRVQAANWVLIRFHDNLSDLEIKEIRADHFDEISALEAILRKAKESGAVPTELRALLQKQISVDEPPKRKAKKPLTDDYVNDVTLEKEANEAGRD